MKHPPPDNRKSSPATPGSTSGEPLRKNSELTSAPIDSNNTSLEPVWSIRKFTLFCDICGDPADWVRNAPGTPALWVCTTCDDLFFPQQPGRQEVTQ